MTEFKIYKLTFQTPLHLSRGKIASYESSDSVLHSDTIKSALYVAALQLDKKEFADKLMEELIISSAFPFDSKGCWLPRPLGFSFEDETADNRKAQKNIAFFSENQFSAILKGHRNSEVLEVLTHKLDKIWEREITQRVWINGNPNNTTPFYLEKLYPIEGTGLYFMVHNNAWQDTDFKQFEGILNLLGENGIGLQRNLGNGRFDVKKSTLNLDLPNNAETWVNLSLYRPKDETEVTKALEKDRTSYQFIKRGGWMSSPENDAHITVRKQSVMMFTEGSVFEFGKHEKQILQKGKYVNLKPLNWTKPMNDVYRDGKAIFLPIILPDDTQN